MPWNEDHLYYVNNHKRSNDIIGHDDCRRRTGDFIVKVRSEDGMRNHHGRLENIYLKYDMEDDRGYDGESRRSSSLSRCGVEGRQRGEGHGGYTRKKGRSSQSDSSGTDLEHGISALTETHCFNRGDEDTLSL